GIGWRMPDRPQRGPYGVELRSFSARLALQEYYSLSIAGEGAPRKIGRSDYEKVSVCVGLKVAHLGVKSEGTPAVPCDAEFSTVQAADQINGTRLGHEVIETNEPLTPDSWYMRTRIPKCPRSCN